MSDTPIADMVEQMLAAGSLPAMIVLAVRTVEIEQNVSREMSANVRRLSAELSADTEDKHERRKRLDRDRKAAKRAQVKDKEAGKQTMSGANLSAQCPQTKPDNADNRCDLLSLEEARKEEATGKEEKKESKKGTRLNQDTPLAANNLQFALDAGMTPERARQAWAEFIDYWIGVPGTRGCKLNWDSTWRNRVRELTGKGGRQKPGKAAGGGSWLPGVQ